MRWQGQQLGVADSAALPGLERVDGLVRSVTTPEFAGLTFHEVLCKSALNHVPGASRMPFDWTVNPYRGCSHACTYCLHPDTRIHMADGRRKALRDVMVGDEVIGTERGVDYRTYVSSIVTAKRVTRKRAYRVRLSDGTEIIASGDHRFLTERGWKYVTPAEHGSQRPHLTTNNRLLGFGLGSVPPAHVESELFRRGYLAGMIRGDGMMLRREYPRSNRRGTYIASRFRLALADEEALTRSRSYLSSAGVETIERPFSAATPERRAMNALFTSQAGHYDAITALIEWVDGEPEWQRGFLSGIFDAEGSCSRGVVRVSNKDPQMLSAISNAFSTFGFDAIQEPARDNGVVSVRLRGGLPARQRFFDLVRPAITRKIGLLGTAIKSPLLLRVTAIEDTGETIEMMDITTTTSDFVANGVVSHNCFARGTHEYLDLDGGRDFDTQVVVKVNVADVLEKELRRGSWQHEPVMLGTNTDPYQRAEGRYRLMPDIIGTLADSGTPFSILTKGTLLRRDLPALVDAAKAVRVSLAMSIAIFDDTLQKQVEHGTPTTQARLDTIRAATDAGFRVTVFLMPILPHLTDSIPALDDALTRIKASGATRVVFGALHLRPGVKPWFLKWLAEDHPELVSSYLGLYPGAAVEAPKAYRTWLTRRVRPLLKVHGLDGYAEEDHPRGAPSPGLAARSRVVVTSKGAGLAATSPTLF